MTSQAKCPKCGMVQMAHAFCKACGTALGAPAHGPQMRPVPGKGTGPTGYVYWVQGHRRLLLLGGIGVLVVLAGIYGVRSMSIRAEAARQEAARQEAVRRAEAGRQEAARQEAARQEAVRQEAARRAEAGRQEAARRAETERRAANEAFQTLQGLESVTTAGVTYREYTRRVLDAKIQVDTYVRAAGGNAMIKRSAREAMDLYVLASDVWNASIRKDYRALAEHPVVKLCPYVKSTRDQVVRTNKSEFVSRTTMAGIAVSSSVPLIWNCASDKTKEIARLLH